MSTHGRHLAMEIRSNKTFIYLCTAATPSPSAYLSQLLLFFSDPWSLALTVTTSFESFFHLSVLCSLLFLLLPDCFLMDKLCLLTVPSPPPHRPSLTFHRQTPFCPLSHIRCISIGVRPPRWTQTQVDSSCGGGIYSPVGFLTPNLPTNPQPPRHTQAHLASGGSVSLLALDTCLSLHNIKSSYLIWTVIMS